MFYICNTSYRRVTDTWSKEFLFIWYFIVTANSVRCIECLVECYYPLILRSVLTLTGRLNCTWLSDRVSELSWLELFTARLISNDETSSRKLTVGCNRIRNETCQIDWMLEFMFTTRLCYRGVVCGHVYMKIFTLLLPAMGLPRSHFKTCSFLWDGGEHRTGGEVPPWDETSSNSVLI